MVIDRFADSTTAYQGYGRGLPLRLVRATNDLATGGLAPDLTVLLDAPPAAALGRALRRAGDAGGERFEDEDVAFHRRVRAGYKRMARSSPDRWLLLDGLADREAIHARVWKRVEGMLGSERAGPRSR